MESGNETPKWLDRLQQESWNLELLISGFSIYLLFQARELIEGLIEQVHLHYIGGFFGSFMLILVLICYLGSNILVFNLIIHIFLRGFWIGAIGLSSVQNKRDFSNLNYTESFTNRLNEKVPKLKSLIVRLDNFCSTIFAFTFLIVLMLLSFFSVVIVLIFFIGIISKIETLFFPNQTDYISIIQLIVFLLFSLTGLLYLIDTLTLGGLKKIRWLQKIYYPIYRFFNFISFSSIYNALYYHLLTRFPKRYLMMALIFYVILFFMGPFFTYNRYKFYPDNPTSSELFTNMYDEERSKEESVGNATIPSLIINDEFLPVFIRYNNENNEVILKNCQDYQPSKKSDFISGIQISSDGINITTPSVKENEPKKLLNCLQQHYRIYLNDSLYHQTDFYFFEQPYKNHEKGLRTVLDIANLPRGKNLLKITRQDFDKSDLQVEKEHALIPFWKE